MIEPRPKLIKIDDLKDRPTRIGVVLKEDQLKTLSLTVRGSSILINDQIFQPNQKLNATVNEDLVAITVDNKLVREDKKIILTPQATNGAITSDCGVEIFPTIAGRTFHWRKQISAIYPGEIEISVEDNYLVCVNTLLFEDYLACVVVSEMSANVPDEFIKAQAIAARSWAVCFNLEKHPNEPFELCNDDDCQRYHGVTFATKHALDTALKTRGEYLIYQNSVVAGYYSKSCGGYSEAPEDCFGFPVNGLIAVPDGVVITDPKNINDWVSNLKPNEEQAIYCSGAGVDKDLKRSFLGGVDDDTKHFRWKHTVPKKIIIDRLKEFLSINDISTITNLTPIKVGASGRIHQLKISYTDSSNKNKDLQINSQYEIRQILHESFLYSSAFTIDDQGDKFLLSGAGWGHGVGLCQMGAAFQALAGRDYKQILNTYFPLAEIEKVY